jgi:hypothetical protein
MTGGEAAHSTAWESLPRFRWLWSALSYEIRTVQKDVREHAFVRLLEGVHADGFIEIYRQDSEDMIEDDCTLVMQKHRESAVSASG